MNVLLIVTGSIAAYKAVDLANHFRRGGHAVKIVLTDSAQRFIPALTFTGQRHTVYVDADEWSYAAGVLHVDLAHWADTMVVAPATANTLAKYQAGITDNLALSALRAFRGTVYLAPAMNTVMYENSAEVLSALRSKNVRFIDPAEKLLACGDVGLGALAPTGVIVESVLRPLAPLDLALSGATSDSESFRSVSPGCVEIPISGHCGSFGFSRRHHQHEGVDLYAPEGAVVRACRSGTVVAVGAFTGENAASPWWLPTQYVAVQGNDEAEATLYGELIPRAGLAVGDRVAQGAPLGHVTQVLREDKGRPTCMLHFERYASTADALAVAWESGAETPHGLLDPTDYLQHCWWLVLTAPS